MILIMSYPNLAKSLIDLFPNLLKLISRLSSMCHGSKKHFTLSSLSPTRFCCRFYALLGVSTPLMVMSPIN